MEFAGGFSAVEEGDDRLRPAIVGHIGFNETYTARLYYFGRTFGPIDEQTFIISGQKHWSLFKSQFLSAGVGAAVMNEMIKVKYVKTADEGQNINENNLNFGAVFGIGAGLPKGPLHFQVNWDSHVFPAGIAGIFLASGRKQTISITMGVRL